ncbi:MAG: PAS domain S-box protein [Anaerolineae bacterium]|nr:PAS domain S-box protein [Anaerolineae bacterium]
MNYDASVLSGMGLLSVLPYITTLLDREAHVLQQFNAESTTLFTACGEVFLADRAPDAVAHLQQVAYEAKAARFETEIAAANGESQWFEHDAVIASDSSILIVFSRDVTSQKTMEIEFKCMKRRYDAILDNTSDAITISAWGHTYDDKQLLYINRRTEELLGYSFDELLTMRPSDILANDYKANAFERHLLRDSGQALEMVPAFPIVRKDGTARFVQSLGILTHNDDGKVAEAIAIVRDVTERVEREEQLKQAKLAAEAALTARDVFVANMSEELRRPLDDILEHSRLLLGHAGTPTGVAERLRQIHDEAGNLGRQIRDVLDLSRVEAGFDVVETSMFNLPYLLRRLEDSLRLKAQQKRLTFDLDIAENLPILIQTDEVKLKQILVNLLGDAINMTDHGGISMRVICLPDNALRFTIADTRISERSALDLRDFASDANEPIPHREENNHRSLGIAISARLVEVLSGRFVVEQSGEGAIVTVELQFVPVRGVSPASEMPALPSQAQLRRFSAEWLHQMYAFCVAGQHEQARAHLMSLDAPQSDIGIQLGALINLFYLDQVADLIEPLL